MVELPQILLSIQLPHGLNGLYGASLQAALQVQGRWRGGPPFQPSLGAISGVNLGGCGLLVQWCRQRQIECKAGTGG